MNNEYSVIIKKNHCVYYIDSDAIISTQFLVPTRKKYKFKNVIFNIYRNIKTKMFYLSNTSLNIY